MKTKMYSFYSRLISSCLVLLGFAACSSGNNDEDDPGNWPLEYGVPSATYKVSGKVVAGDTDKKPIKNIRVVMIPDVDETKYKSIPGDTVSTTNEGLFILKGYAIGAGKYKVKLQDVDGDDNESFEEIIEKIEFKSSDFKDGSGWYKGEAQKDLGTIEMKHKKKTE